MPQGVINLLSGVLPGFVNEVYMALGDLLDILALINNGINFILYCSMSKQFRDTFVSVFRLDVVARLCPTRTFYTRPLNPSSRFCFAYPCARHTDLATRDMCCICAYTYMDILYTL